MAARKKGRSGRGPVFHNPSHAESYHRDVNGLPEMVFIRESPDAVWTRLSGQEAVRRFFASMEVKQLSLHPLSLCCYFFFTTRVTIRSARPMAWPKNPPTA